MSSPGTEHRIYSPQHLWAERQCGDTPQGPYRVLFHLSGAGDYTCIPTRQTRTLDSSKLLFYL